MNITIQMKQILNKYLQIDKKFIVFQFILLSLLTWITIYQPYKNSPPIRSDGVGYHIWVKGFQNLDFSFCEYKDLLNPTQSITHFNKEKNVCGIKYPPGVGIFQFPFSVFFSSNKSDSFSKAEHISILVIGVVLILFISYFSYKTLLIRGCNSIDSILTIFVFLFGSGLFHYGTYDASFSHIYSAFGVSILIWLISKNNGKGWSVNQYGLLTLIIFWMYLVRQTNGLITLLIIFLAICETPKPRKIEDKAKLIFAWFIGTLIAVSIQIFYNYYVSGQIKLSSYGNEGFVGFAPHFTDVLYSYERGLFLYYPAYLVTIFLALIFNRSLIAVLFLILTIFYGVLYGSWDSWFLGGGMGHRGFVELAPIGMICLATSLSKIRNKLYPIIMLGISVYITSCVMVGYWLGSYPFAGNDKNLYFSTIISNGLYSKFK